MSKQADIRKDKCKHTKQEDIEVYKRSKSAMYVRQCKKCKKHILSWGYTE